MPPLETNQRRALLVKTSKITQHRQGTNQNIKSVPRGHKPLTMREQVLPRWGTWSGLSCRDDSPTSLQVSGFIGWTISSRRQIKVQAVFHQNYIACGDTWSQRGFPTVKRQRCGHSTRFWCHPSKGWDSSNHKKGSTPTPRTAINYRA